MNARRATPGFSLVEVVIAIGIFAVGISVIIGLFGPLNRSVAEVSQAGQAARLAEAINIELLRIRDSFGSSATGTKVERFAAQLLNDDAAVLRLVASADGTRVIQEDAAGNASNEVPPGVPKRDRYYLIVVRRQPATVSDGNGDTIANPLAYNGTFFAVTARVEWPYFVPNGPGENDADEADVATRQWMYFNYAIGP